VPTLRWQPLTTLLLSIAGLGVSIYLTITHFDKKVLACASNAVINCEKVTESPQSVIFHIPVAMLGLGFFVPMLLLCLPAAWRTPARWVHLVRLVLSITGVGMIVYLISAELFTIKAICLWCTSVHIITFVLFVIIVTTAPVVLAPGYGTAADDGYDGDGYGEVDDDAGAPAEVDG
jgi:uncharacterized membrane protein